MSASLRHQISANRRYLLLIVLLVITLYVIVPQLGGFRASWRLLRHPVLGWALAAIGATALTYAAAALTYTYLAFHKLVYTQTLTVQLTAMFINRLLPAGIGALGTSFAYLRRERHSPAQAATTVTVNNLLGIIGHLLIVSITLVVTPSKVRIWPTESYPDLHRMLAGFLVIGALIVVVAIITWQRRLKRLAADALKQLASYRFRPLRLGAALMSSMLLTLCNVLCLGCCALALGVHLPFIVILLIFSFGAGTGTVTPTPGGLGGFEAGLTAGFIAYHVAGPAALATALLYRLVSYWLPLLVGAPAFIVAQRQRLLTA
jgi:uncharacterized membrane protein YbhN (UPF0104 family)